MGLTFTTLRRVAALTRRLPPPLALPLLRALVPPGSRACDFEVVTRMRDGLLLHASGRSLAEWEVFFFGAHEAYIVDLLLNLAAPGHVVMDVGANVGTHALPLARRVGGEGLVIAVEPEPVVRERLRANLALNRIENVRVLDRALAAEPGQRTLYTYAAGSPNRMTASLTADASRPGVSVSCATLDATVAELGLERLDLVKADVEGHEPSVLLGARETLARLRPHLVFECVEEHWRRAGHDFQATRSFLEGLSYELHVIGNGWLAPLAAAPPAWANLLAVPR